MKPLNKFLLRTAFSTVALFATSRLHAQQHSFYFKADLGGELTEDTRIRTGVDREILGIVGAIKNTIHFDPGARVGFAAGYNVTDWFSGEAQIGTLVNSIDSVGTSPLTPGFTIHSDSIYANVPLLFNARFQYPNNSRWSPYLGGGLGVSAAILHSDTQYIQFFSGGSEDIHTIRGTDATAVFAYQAFAGMRYRLSEHAGLSVEYRYFVAERPEWNLDYGKNVSFDATQTHALSVAFDWSF